MKLFALLAVFTATIGLSNCANACTMVIDREEIKSELAEKALIELLSLKWPTGSKKTIEATEIVSTVVGDLAIHGWAESLAGFGLLCPSYTEFTTRVTFSITRADASCQAIINVAKVQSYTENKLISHYLFSASVWPYCIK